MLGKEKEDNPIFSVKFLFNKIYIAIRFAIISIFVIRKMQIDSNWFKARGALGITLKIWIYCI